MSISLFGVDWDLLAITIFLLVTFIITQVIKKKIDVNPVFLSWIFALPIYAILSIFKPEVISFWGIIQYIFLVLILNGAYKGSTLLWDFLASKFTFIKKRK